VDTRTLDIVDATGGCRLRVRVSPGARTGAVVGAYAGALKVSVTAPPERGKANHAVVNLLSEALEIPPSRIEITSGHGSRDKTVAIAGMSARDLLARLGAL